MHAPYDGLSLLQLQRKGDEGELLSEVNVQELLQSVQEGQDVRAM